MGLRDRTRFILGLMLIAVVVILIRWFGVSEDESPQAEVVSNLELVDRSVTLAQPGWRLPPCVCLFARCVARDGGFWVGEPGKFVLIGIDINQYLYLRRLK